MSVISCIWHDDDILVLVALVRLNRLGGADMELLAALLRGCEFHREDNGRGTLELCN